MTSANNKANNMPLKTAREGSAAPVNIIMISVGKTPKRPFSARAAIRRAYLILFAGFGSAFGYAYVSSQL
jgi:hypothetical protein